MSADQIKALDWRKRVESEFEHDFSEEEIVEAAPPDPRQAEARRVLRTFFEQNHQAVFFSRQIEVRYEHLFFHWITNRALHDLYREGLIERERRELAWGGSIFLVWNKRYRYARRAANSVVKLVEEYSSPRIGEHLGLHGEQMVQAGFARSKFLLLGEKVRAFEGREWRKTGHDLDFVFERDGVAYGVEVKNTLGYMDHKELMVKVELAGFLGLKPLFVVRMVPKSWIYEVNEAGGFVLVLKYQLYPWTERDLATRVRERLGLPVDAPKKLLESTMRRFLDWHTRNL